MTAEHDFALIALGANLPSRHGSPAQTIEQAFGALAPLSSTPVIRSSLWSSRPVDCPPGSPDFINAAAAIVPRPGLTAETLLEELQALERAFGRATRSATNAPRALDLDLIAWGGQQIRSPQLTLPHPRAHQRAFVLLPLAEIAPGLTLPGQSLSIRELAQQAPDRDVVVRFQAPN